MLPAALLAIIFVASNALAAVLVQPPATVDSLILKKPNYGHNSSELNNSGGSGSNEKLFEAIEKGDVLQVKRVISSGVDLDEPLGNFTPLRLAASEGNLDIVIVLLEFGADVNGKRSPWGSPLIEATFYKNVKIVKVLLAYGANANAGVKGQRTPLMLASHNAEITDLLLTAGAIVDAVDEHGTTALMDACSIYYGNEETVKLLIKAGADVNRVDNHHWNPLKLAKYYHNYEIVDILEAAGARMPPEDPAAGGEQMIM